MSNMSNRRFFSTDKDLESKTGISIIIGNWKFQSRRIGGANEAYQARMAVLRIPHERLLSEKSKDEAVIARQNAVLRPLMIQAAAEKALLFWEGVTEADLLDLDAPDDLVAEKELIPAPFTAENAIRLFTLYPDAWQEYLTEVTTMGNFRRQVVRDAAGNSPAG